MKVIGAVSPLLPLCQRLLPGRLAGLSLTLLKATALEIAILAGHLLLYPSGITPERRPAPAGPTDTGTGAGDPLTPPGSPLRPGHRSSCCTASSTTARSS